MNAADCPGRFSTHPLRKWPIMNQLDAGVPKELLSDRVDVSVPVSVADSFWLYNFPEYHFQLLL